MKRLVLVSDINQLHPFLASRLRELLGGKSDKHQSHGDIVEIGVKEKQ